MLPQHPQRKVGEPEERLIVVLTEDGAETEEAETEEAEPGEESEEEEEEEEEEENWGEGGATVPSVDQSPLLLVAATKETEELEDNRRIMSTSLMRSQSPASMANLSS